MTTTMSALDRIGAMAAAKPKKSKSEKPSYEFPEMEDLVAQYIKQKAAEETAKTLKDAAKDQIVAAATPKRLESCRFAGEVVASITVNKRLTFTVQNRYSVVPEEATDALKAAFGDDFKKHFETTYAISLKAESAREDVITDLLSKLGEDFVLKHFNIVRDLKVRKSFHIAVSTDEKFYAIAKPFMDQQIIKCAAAALKVK